MKNQPKSRKSVPGTLRHIVAENLKDAMAKHPEIQMAKNKGKMVEKLTERRGYKVSKSTISRILNEQSGTSIDAIEAIALALQFRVQDFVISADSHLYAASEHHSPKQRHGGVYSSDSHRTRRSNAGKTKGRRS